MILDSKTYLKYFLSRLEEREIVSIIRDIVPVIKYGNGKEELCSESFDDMDVGIDFPDFYIDEVRIPLSEMKRALYARLMSLNSKTKDYIEEIETYAYDVMRISHLLKFKVHLDELGKKSYLCESLYKKERMCFIQFCSIEDCQYMLKRIIEVEYSLEKELPLFKNIAEDVLVRLEPSNPRFGGNINWWFQIGKNSNGSSKGLSLPTAEKFIKEWLGFLSSN